MSSGQYQYPQGTYQGIDQHSAYLTQQPNQSLVPVQDALMRIARALEGIESELKRHRVPTGTQTPSSSPQGTTQPNATN
jgi:hypothetical protein